MSDNFDVARWSIGDIQTIMDELNIEIAHNDRKDFYSAVVDDLRINFDASIGINWDTIKYSVECVWSDLK